MKKLNKHLCISMGLLAAFAAWTAAVCIVDVQPVGPLKTNVGFAEINLLVHRLTGVHFVLYTLTDWLSLIPAGICAGFGILGLKQWIQRRHLLKVDRSLLLLGGFYAAVLAVYLLFEIFPVNYRPVLIDGRLEASYPSSTTMLVMCVMPAARMQLDIRIKNNRLRKCTSAVIIIFTFCMVAARFLSGVHWFSDIIGGALVSSGLVMLYSCLCNSK